VRTRASTPVALRPRLERHCRASSRSTMTR
jgi:hypothetical protein